MVKRENILVTGGNGQLGQSLFYASPSFTIYNFFFSDKKSLDITNFKHVKNFIEKNDISIIINCAAYTDVVKAEKESDIADLINNASVENLANLCFEKNIKLVHISTDYVFDGYKSYPYVESDSTKPLNNYGLSKLKGEDKILKLNLKNSIIIRTSWLYSYHSKSFVSKIINKIGFNKPFGVNCDEFGSPTNSNDLALAIFMILSKLNNKETKIYHFSNSGVCSRFEFALEINKLIKYIKNYLFKNPKGPTWLKARKYSLKRILYFLNLINLS